MPLTVLAAAGEPQYNSDVQNKPASKSARKPVQKRPTYSIEAVDNALQLLQLLRDGGTLRLKDAAEELGVAPSTAHRLLAMLVRRSSLATRILQRGHRLRRRTVAA